MNLEELASLGNAFSIEYTKCPECGYLLGPLAERGACCSNCGYTGSLTSFPSFIAMAVFRMIQQVYKEGTEESKQRTSNPYHWKVIVILSCTFMELLLEEIVEGVLEKNGANAQLGNAILDTISSRGKRVKFFNSLTGSSLAQELGEVWHAWEKAIKKRNLFLHENPYAIGRQEADEAFELTLRAVSAFAKVQQKFCVKSKKGRSE